MNLHILSNKKPIISVNFKTQIVQASKNNFLEILEKVRYSFAKNLPIVIPTETVYGIAAPYNNETAIQRIFEIKNRPQDNPLIVHIANLEQFDLVSSIPFTKLANEYQILLKNFWPGALTVVVSAKPNIFKIVTAGLSTVAIRMPSHEFTKQLIQELDCPLVAPSANKSGKPSGTLVEDVFEDFDSEVVLIVDGGQSEFGLESTVLDLSDATPKLLRPGVISLEQLLVYLENIEVHESVLNPKQVSEGLVKAPGMKYTHYSPTANLIAFEDPAKITDMFDSSDMVISYQNLIGAVNEHCCLNITDFERNLFKIFRQADRSNVKNIYCQLPLNSNSSVAIRNRIIKAANTIL